MTNTQVNGSNLVVVDGSNIATEGRSIPSLAQLNEAVISLTQEFPDITVTVVVDATFGHRIAKSEVAEFDEAVAHNELVTPPAGAIGRGDAFVLSIANKVGARIFSNDSFQEFHGVYPWLFDEGRLIGGKPVPHVGWVFVNRVPVKGPLSRKARSSGRDGGRDGNVSRRPVSPLASLPMPIPTSPPPRAAEAEAVAVAAAEPVDTAPSGRGRGRKAAAVPVRPLTPAEPVPAIGRDATAPPSAPAVTPSGGPVNDLLPFLDFIQQHPVGSSVTGVVESYSSHGAYVTIGDLRGYVPLRLMGNPPPRSAREVMRSGERVTLVVASIAPARRSVDLAVPGVGDAVAPAAEVAGTPKPARGRGAKKAVAQPAVVEAAVVDAPAPEPPRGRRKKAAATAAPDPAPIDQPAKKRAPSKSAAKKPGSSTVVPAPAEPEQPPTPAKRTRAKALADVAPEPETVVPKKSAPKRAAAKKAAAKKAAAATVETGPPDAHAVSPKARRRRQAKPTTD